MSKPILSVDFDGVVHGYQSGWQGAHLCSDPPVPGAIDFLCRVSEHFTVHIYSSRSHQEGGLVAMQQWLADHAAKDADETTMNTRGDSESAYTARIAWLYRVVWPTCKPSAKVTIDDRAITFTGSWPAIQDLIDFEPWNKQGGVRRSRVIPNVDAARYMDIERRHIELIQLLLDADAKIVKFAAAIHAIDATADATSLLHAAIRAFLETERGKMPLEFHEDVGGARTVVRLIGDTTATPTRS